MTRQPSTKPKPKRVSKGALQAMADEGLITPASWKGPMPARMDSIAAVELSPAAFRHVQLHSKVARYAFLINVCQLVARSFLPDENTGRKRFHPFTANEQELRKALTGVWERRRQLKAVNQ